MITITSAQLDAWLTAFIFPMTRILGLVATAPVFNSAAMPVFVRLSIGLAITVGLIPILPPITPISGGSWFGLALLAQQLLVGVLMGFALRLAFVAVDVAGELISMQMGLSFAVAYDPQNAGQTPVLSEFMGLIVLLIFLAMNGHLMTLAVLVESFNLLPVEAFPFHAAGFATLLRWASVMFALGLMLSLPLIAALLIANIALGVLSRIAPSLNLFAIGFPVTLAVGYLVLMFSLPYLGSSMENLFTLGFRTMQQILETGAGR